MSATEDSITDLMSEYLRDNGIDARTQISISGPSTRSQPDLQISNGGTFVGESKWEDNKWKGFGEARDYSQLTGVEGAFLISYPNELKSEKCATRNPAGWDTAWKRARAVGPPVKVYRININPIVAARVYSAYYYFA